MAVTLLVKHVSLEEHALPHRRVKSVHGLAGEMVWEHSREQVIAHISNQLFYYYFHKDGRAVRIVLDRTGQGEVFLKAEMDAETPHALLQLPIFNPKPPPNLIL
jgi:hypothetical protein